MPTVRIIIIMLAPIIANHGKSGRFLALISSSRIRQKKTSFSHALNHVLAGSFLDLVPLFTVFFISFFKSPVVINSLC